MTEPTDAELIAELEAAGVSFLAFLGGLSGAKKVWTTSGSQDAKKIAAGMRAAIAKWGAPQPTQAQAGAVPLTIAEIEQMLSQWSYEIHGDRARYLVRMTEQHHGIKGGQT